MKSSLNKVLVQSPQIGAFLVARWQRIHLPMQETWVRSLIQEDPTCCRPEPVRHNCWACALALRLRLLKPWCLGARAPQREGPPQWDAWALQLDSSLRSSQLEKSPCSRDPAQPKIKTENYILKRPQVTGSFLGLYKWAKFTQSSMM